MRYLLALALVLQFSGLSAAWARPCAMGQAGAGHACCLARQGGPVRHVSGSCGCQMTPAPAAPPAATVSTAPDGATDHGIPTADATRASVTPVLEAAADNQDHSPPGPAPGTSLSRLSGSGFRC